MIRCKIKLKKQKEIKNNAIQKKVNILSNRTNNNLNKRGDHNYWKIRKTSEEHKENQSNRSCWNIKNEGY